MRRPWHVAAGCENFGKQRLRRPWTTPNAPLCLDTSKDEFEPFKPEIRTSPILTTSIDHGSDQESNLTQQQRPSFNAWIVMSPQ